MNADPGFDADSDADFEARLDEALADRSEILPSSGVQKFRRNTAAGAVLNAMALGLREVFEPTPREEAPIVQDAPAEPDHDRHVDAHLDPDDPASSSVTVRPWLAASADQTGADQTSADQTSATDRGATA